MKPNLLKIGFTNLTKLFIGGLIILLPLFICFYTIYKVFTVVDGVIPRNGIFESFYFPGLGVIVVIIITISTGFIIQKFVNIPINDFIDKNIKRLPVISMIYTSARDLMKALVGEEKRFNRPVIVCISKENQIYKLGFITDETLPEIGLDETMAAVYFPHSYNFSGELMIVPISNIKKIEVDSGTMMKFIVSGGVTNLEE